jgi:catechol 2,3-dioxygenase-like lactoylglutathione lyase family enzyme
LGFVTQQPDVAAGSVSAQLSVRRGREAVDFYRAALGAEEIYRVGGADAHEAVVSHLRVGETTFWVADESPPHANFSSESLAPGPHRRPVRAPLGGRHAAGRVAAAKRGLTPQVSGTNV